MKWQSLCCLAVQKFLTQHKVSNLRTKHMAQYRRLAFRVLNNACQNPSLSDISYIILMSYVHAQRSFWLWMII